MPFYVGDSIDFKIIVRDANTFPKDIHDATTLDLLFESPDRNSFTRPAAFVTDGQDGQIGYTSTRQDFTLPGLWKVQAFYETPLTAKHTDIHAFQVFPNLGR